jgi:mono/diheme cytochrome c family protein
MNTLLDKFFALAHKNACKSWGLMLFCCLLGPATYLPAQAQENNAEATLPADVVDKNGTSDLPAGGSQPRTQDPAQVEQGKTIFNNNCSACHAVTNEVVVGPGLQGINERRQRDWLINWIHNPQKVVDSGDKYANDLLKKFNGNIMPAFPDLTDQEIQSVLAYIDVAGTGENANTITGGDADGKLVPSGSGSTVAGGGLGSTSFTIILVALLVILLLVLLVLIMIVSLLSKFLSDKKDLTPEDREVLEQKVNWKGIAGSSAFKGGVALIFALVVGKVANDQVMSIGIQQGYAPKQPIAYSHKLHAGQYQIDCNYCHTTVSKGKTASIPSLNICMNCHGVIKTASPEIQKIYAAIEQNKPVEWVRVHNLPDLAYFNHAQHVNVGQVACQTCHGEIQNMEVVQHISSLTMGWCIDCHRKTEVNGKDNAYYDKLVALHSKESKEPMRVANIGGLECTKCHY